MNVLDGVVRWENTVLLAGSERSWGELAEEWPGWPGERVAVITSTPFDACRALAAGLRDGIDLCIVADRTIGEAERSGLRLDGYWVIEQEVSSAPESKVDPVVGRITVLTSGTTGAAKQIGHNLSTLATMKDRDHPSRRWLWPYTPGTYAWYQIAALGLTVPDQTLVPVDPDDDWVELARERRVDAVSATPTFWRRSQLAASVERLGAIPLVQITLGGEPIDQSLLDQLRLIWPGSRITHIYASTEAGACIAVSDGRAGFPASWLERPSGGGVRLRVDEGRLYVSSPWAAPAADEWIDTGDLVRTNGDRIEIVGRAGRSIANVGGSKVRLADVEEVLGAHPDVIWVRASAHRAPVVGELPVADVCLTRASTATERELIDWCRKRLPELAVPRIVRVVEDIPTTSALKARV